MALGFSWTTGGPELKLKQMLSLSCPLAVLTLTVTLASQAPKRSKAQTCARDEGHPGRVSQDGYWWGATQEVKKGKPQFLKVHACGDFAGNFMRGS